MALNSEQILDLLMEDDDESQDGFSTDLEDFSASESEYLEESSSDESDSDLGNFAVTPKIRSRKPTQSVPVPQVNQHGWTNVPQEPPKFDFQGIQGLKLSSQELSPKCFADLFFNDEFMMLLVNETNKYAAQEITKKGLMLRSSRFKQWHDTNVSEMKIFLGLLFHMGPFSLPTIEHYWKSSAFYNVPFWRNIMSRNRFQILLRFLHYSDNNDPIASTDRLHKIRPVLNHINNTMDTIYSPGQNLCIDESMVLWRGRLMFRQYIKNKRHKFGIKLYELCESNGNVLKIQVYCGKSKDPPTGVSLTSEVVITLMDGFLDKGHILYTDNFYNSVALTKTMTDRSTYICGTLRFNRKENPKELVEKKLKRGEHSWMRSDSVVVCKWKDKRDVLSISNMHKVEMIDYTNANKKVSKKPNIIKDYIDGMSGIDKSDQMLSYYSCLRKTLRWYKKLGIHFFEVYIQNAHIMYSNQPNIKKIKSLEFREQFVAHLIGAKMPTTTPGPSCTQVATRQPRISSRQSEMHYLQVLPSTGKKNPTKPCRVCTKAKRRKETRYFCESCPDKPALCVVDCFKIYHQNISN